MMRLYLKNLKSVGQRIFKLIFSKSGRSHGHGPAAGRRRPVYCQPGSLSLSVWHWHWHGSGATVPVASPGPGPARRQAF
jgi:hypothetical protein